MQVTVKLFGALREFLPAGSSFKSCKLTLADDADLSEVLALLPIPQSKPFLVIFNDLKIDRDVYAGTKVSATDEIVLLPPIKGG